MSNIDRYRALRVYQRDHGLGLPREQRVSSYLDHNSYLFKYFPKFYIPPDPPGKSDGHDADFQDTCVDVFLAPSLPECFKAVETEIHPPPLEKIEPAQVESCSLRHSVSLGKGVVYTPLKASDRNTFSLKEAMESPKHELPFTKDTLYERSPVRHLADPLNLGLESDKGLQSAIQSHEKAKNAARRNSTDLLGATRFFLDSFEALQQHYESTCAQLPR